MSDVMNIGRGGVLAYRSALAATSENIANVDSDGYTRRDAVMREVGVGAGVDVVELRRAFDGLLADRGRTAQGGLNAAEAHLTHLAALEDRLLPGAGGVPALLDGFFDALDGLAAAPSDAGLRQSVLSAGSALASGVSDLALRLDALAEGVAAETRQAAHDASGVLDALAQTQERLARVEDGAARNPLLDRRDSLLNELARLIDIDVALDDRGRATVRLGADGAGPIVLSGARAGAIAAGPDGRLEMHGPGPGAGVHVPAAGGTLGGLASASGAIAQALRDLDDWSGRMAGQMNARHAEGVTPSGDQGGPLFSQDGWRAEPGALMRGNAVLRAVVTDADRMQDGPLTAVFDAALGGWQVRGGAGTVLAEGASPISLPGLRLEVEGVPLDGDRITLSQDAGARHFRMAIAEPDLIAAAGAWTVSAAPTNKGDAVPYAASAAPAATSGLPRDLSSGGGTGMTEFLSPGIVGMIPAGAASATLSVQPRLATSEIALPPGAALLRLEVEAGGEAPGFDLPAGIGAADAVAALNRGDLRADGRSLAELGLIAGIEGGALTLTAREGGAAPAPAARLLTDGGSIEAMGVADAAPAAMLSVFTRDGRQLSGAPLGAAEAAALLTQQNGFHPGATYNADYLGGAAPYGALDMSRRTGNGDEVLTLGGAAGAAAGIATWTGATPAPSAPAKQIIFEAGGETTGVSLPAGASAAWRAQILSDALPVAAAAETRLSLSLPPGGTLRLGLVGDNLDPVEITSEAGPGGAARLAAAINAAEAVTGIRAEMPANGARLTLIHDGGADIALSGVALSGPGALGLTRMDGLGQPLGGVTLGGAGPDGARVAGTVRLTGAASFALREDDVLIRSAPDGFSSGLIARESTAAGSVVDLRPAEPGVGDTALRRIEVTGGDGRIHSASADPLRIGDPADAAGLAAALLTDLRSGAPASRIAGAAMPALPPDGAQMRVALGDQDYAITMRGGVPVVSGPEADRVTARFDAQNRLTLETVGGDLDGAALRLPVDAGDAARFGMGAADTPMTTVIGQPFDAANLPASFTVSLGGAAYSVAVTAGNVVLPPTFPGTGYINTAHGRIEIRFDANAGDFDIPPQPSGAALGMDTAGLSATLDAGALRLVTTDGRVAEVSVPLEAMGQGAGQSQAQGAGGGTVLTMAGLPKEDLLVHLSGGGALRLAASVEGAAAEPSARPRELRVLDAETRLVGLFDVATGAHIASRSADPSGLLRFADVEVTLAGNLVTGDRFALTAAGGRGGDMSGDGRTIGALADLRQRDGLTGAGGYGAGFASLQQRVGAQVAAAQTRHATAEAEEASAAKALSRIGGVDLDAEAARLMQQQQAYQANAQVMSVARELFDTLLQAI